MTSIEDILLEKIDVLSNALVEEQRKNRKASDDIDALEKSNSGFRAKVVDLHTEIQDLKGEIVRLNHVLSDRLQTINSLKRMCQSSDDERPIDETPDVVVKVAFLELP